MSTVAIANTDAQLLSATLLQTGLAATVTALYTFDRDPSAPFAVTSGSAVVTNLDADKLDGREATAFFESGVSTSVALGTGAAEDIKLTFDGNAQDFYLGLDDSEDDLVCGLGTTVGTTPVWSVEDARALNLHAAVRASGIISDTLSAQADDYSPSGLSTAFALRISMSGGNQTITGIAAQPSGTLLLICNAEGDGGNVLTLADQDAGSSASNRFDGPNATDVTLNPGDSIWVWRDGTSSRWRPISL